MRSQSIQYYVIAIIFLLLALLVLNPYTIAGPLAYYVALPLCGLALLHGTKYLTQGVFFAFVICITISVIGVVSSLLHGIAQIEHFKVAVSIFVYYLVGIGLFLAFRKSGASIDDVALAALWVGVANGLVILMQVQFPQFRAMVESFFVASGNIDWTEGFRYRGLAAGGGASLSVFIPICVYITMYLYDVRKIGILFTISTIVILISSVFFIGRTGVVLLPLALLFYACACGRKVFKAVLIWGGISFLLVLLGFEHLKEFIILRYDEEFYRYALGYFLEGAEGFQREGTVGTIIEFMGVVPREFPEVLIGYGFYGGSDFSPWTDSGYARMFLSVGYVFGAIFYASAIYIFHVSSASKRVLFLPLMAILMIAEAKEGLLFAGYSSRLVFILTGFWMAARLYNCRQIRNRPGLAGKLKTKY